MEMLDQDVDVNRMGSRNSSLNQYEVGGEIEALFFRKLDEELNKVSTFDKDKVDVVMSDAVELNKQLDVLITLRIKEKSKDPTRDKISNYYKYVELLSGAI